jgi:predicted nucleotide-binding protein (sugar kinase/HSP70/actin superfamily)
VANNIPDIITAFKALSAPMGALLLLAVLNWRQHSLIKSAMDNLKDTLTSTTATFKDLFKSQSDTQERFSKTFSEATKRFNDDLRKTHVEILTSLNETNQSVATLTGKLDSVNLIVDHKISMIPKTEQAVEDRIKRLEQNVALLKLEDIKKKQ